MLSKISWSREEAKEMSDFCRTCCHRWRYRGLRVTTDARIVSSVFFTSLITPSEHHASSRHISTSSPWSSRRNACRGCCQRDTAAAGPAAASWRTSSGPRSTWGIVELLGTGRRRRTGYAARSSRAWLRARSCHLCRSWSTAIEGVICGESRWYQVSFLTTPLEKSSLSLSLRTENWVARVAVCDARRQSTRARRHAGKTACEITFRSAKSRQSYSTQGRAYSRAHTRDHGCQNAFSFAECVLFR